MDQFGKNDIVQQLQELQETFFRYFPEETTNCNWVRTHSVVRVLHSSEKSIELSSDGNLKLQFTNQSPSKFWIKFKMHILHLQDKL